MINLPLKKEILIQIYKGLGLFSSTGSFSEGITNDKFIIDKTIKFESDEGQEYQNKVWGAIIKLEDNSILKIIIGDLTETNKEYAILIQLDDFPPYATRMSNDPEDYGSCYFRVEDKWINASTLFQAKLLIAIESLSELFPTWEPIKDYNNLYTLLVGFLKFDND